MPFIIIGVIIAVAVVAFISIKRDDKKKKDYADKNMTEKVIEDSFFGQMKFSYDSRKNELTYEDFEPAFCGNKPTVKIHNYSEQDEKLCFRSLEYLYGRQAEILSGMINEFCESYGDITEDEAKENISIEWIIFEKLDDYYKEKICDSDELFITVEGKYMGGSEYYQLPCAFMNCATKEIFYSVEE